MFAQSILCPAHLRGVTDRQQESFCHLGWGKGRELLAQEHLEPRASPSVQSLILIGKNAVVTEADTSLCSHGLPGVPPVQGAAGVNGKWLVQGEVGEAAATALLKSLPWPHSNASGSRDAGTFGSAPRKMSQDFKMKKILNPKLLKSSIFTVQ